MNNTDRTPIANQNKTKMPTDYQKSVIGYFPVDWKIVELSKLAVILFSNVDTVSYTHLTLPTKRIV